MGSSRRAAAVVAAWMVAVWVAAVCGSTPAAQAQRPAHEVVLLRDAVATLVVVDEGRDGFSRDKFRHWVDADGDGCSTRAEVLLDEAVSPPVITGRCLLSGGRWYSFYDDTLVDNPGGLDIDHMVPLAQAWDSGAFAWTPQRREYYANDLDEPVSLWAVTARANRSKADRDPSEWLPPHGPAVCEYLTAWVTVKTRWALSVDPAEHSALTARTADCPNVAITTTPARSRASSGGPAARPSSTPLGGSPLRRCRC